MKFKVGDKVREVRNGIVGQVKLVKEFEDMNIYTVRFAFERKGYKWEENRIYVGENDLEFA